MKRIWRFCFQGRAFSLVETMVAAGIAGGLTLGYLQLTDNTNKTKKKIESGFEIDMIALDMAQVLSNDGACAHILQGNTSGEINGIRSSQNKVLFRKSKKYGQNLITLQSMKLVNADISPTDGFGSVVLEVTFQKESKLIKGKKTEVRRIPLSVRKTGGSVVCNPDHSMRVSGSDGKREMCDAIGGSMNSGRCTPPFLGQTCSTYIVGFDGNGGIVCEPRYTFP